MKYLYPLLLLITILSSCSKDEKKEASKKLAADIQNNVSYDSIKSMSLRLMKTGFNAGDGYAEVWIRDYNTFIELAAEVYPKETLRENLLVFFRLQGKDGNIADGFIPKDKVQPGGYDYIYSETEPRYAGHKNTVEMGCMSFFLQSSARLNLCPDYTIVFCTRHFYLIDTNAIIK